MVSRSQDCQRMFNERQPHRALPKYEVDRGGFGEQGIVSRARTPLLAPQALSITTLLLRLDIPNHRE